MKALLTTLAVLFAAAVIAGLAPVPAEGGIIQGQVYLPASEEIIQGPVFVPANEDIVQGPVYLPEGGAAMLRLALLWLNLL